MARIYPSNSHSYGWSAALGRQPAAETVQPLGPSLRKSVPPSESDAYALRTYTPVAVTVLALGSPTARIAFAHGCLSSCSSFEAVSWLSSAQAA